MHERWAEWTLSDRLPQGPRRAVLYSPCWLCSGLGGSSAPSCQPAWVSLPETTVCSEEAGWGAARSLTGDTITSRYLSPS